MNATDIPLLSFSFVELATDYFSPANMLGEGGFGPVYKGALSGGEEIAVKRLSRISGQGLEEFKNEINVIAKLQHRNLVRLLGYCVHEEDKMIVYEYMSNKSLDFFLGYMSPEYAMEGVFSVKSDVYSFGVLVLEIVSGRRNTSFRYSDHSYFCHFQAWELWSQGRALELTDSSIRDTCSATDEQLLRRIQVGMLCVQGNPVERPTMAGVMSWLENDSLSLPVPRQPTYTGRLPGGEEIAVKRLSKISGQGLEEFKNEISLIAKLQHRNLVRLLGYCVHDEEKMLIYEYMPNKSLDFFLGYMSPEYAMEGLFSVKSDVYSFGVLVLEIVSGRKNTSFRFSDHASLIAYAWELWSQGRAMEMVDSSIRESCRQEEMLRCIQVGMLCVQGDPVHRPTMAEVMLMIERDSQSLPMPRQPTFTSSTRRGSVFREVDSEEVTGGA
ncbi:G-type lectin S-receptor-like serine/threonine-protein kinase B120 [Linum perenne]